MSHKKKVKFGRLALVCFLGIQLGLVLLIFRDDSDLATNMLLSKNQLYMCMAFLVVVYVLYLKLATHSVGETLHKEKEKLHRIVECIPNATLLINPEGQITFFNTMASKELGLDISQHTLASVKDIFDCPDPNPFQAGFAGHATCYCKTIEQDVEVIVDSHKSAEGQ